MLRYRLLSALVVITSSLVFVGLDAWGPGKQHGGIWMVPLIAYFLFGSAIECVWMSRTSGQSEAASSLAWPALIGSGGVMLAAAVPVYWPLFGEPYPSDCPLGPLGWPLAAAGIALLGCFLWFLPQYDADRPILRQAVLAGWIASYFGIGFAFAVALRRTGTPAWGLFLLVGIITITKFADAGAYFCGRAFGRTKLCPAISPGKTIEGLIGGMVVATLVTWIYFDPFATSIFAAEEVNVSWVGIFLTGISLTLVGVIGDLIASVFKREMGVKDSGSLMPGLGGLWDVTDSLLPAAITGYLIVVAELLQGPS